MSDINVTITEQETINVAIEESQAINISLSMYSGDSDHSKLTNLGYDNSGHTGFQRELIWDDLLGCYLIDRS